MTTVLLQVAAVTLSFRKTSSVTKPSASPPLYTVSFQSRLGKDPWIRPYTSEVVEDLAARGTKKILAFSPSFVVDCLETTIEIGEECREHFQENGGEELQLVESLNAHPLWIEAAQDIVMKSS